MKLGLQEIRKETLPVTITRYACLENKYTRVDRTSSMNGNPVPINPWFQSHVLRRKTRRLAIASAETDRDLDQSGYGWPGLTADTVSLSKQEKSLNASCLARTRVLTDRDDMLSGVHESSLDEATNHELYTSLERGTCRCIARSCE